MTDYEMASLRLMAYEMVCCYKLTVDHDSQVKTPAIAEALVLLTVKPSQML